MFEVNSNVVVRLSNGMIAEGVILLAAQNEGGSNIYKVNVSLPTGKYENWLEGENVYLISGD